MDSLDQALVRAVIQARITQAGERRLADEATRDRRAARWAARRARADAPTRQRRLPRWPWRRPAPTPERPAPAATTLRIAPPPAIPDEVELARLLADVAEKVAERGTGSQRRVLAEMAAATRSVAPGAAAALVDRDGSEVARLRAFGRLHGVVLNELTEPQQHRLLERLRGGRSERQALVA